MLRGLDVLGPEIGLRTDDVRSFIGSEILRDGIETVYALERKKSADRERLVLPIPLVVVELHVAVRRHDDIVPGLRGLDATIDAAP